jgi:hypothetical protein
MKTCKHCGKAIWLLSTYWTHKHNDRVMCDDRKNQAQPK